MEKDIILLVVGTIVGAMNAIAGGGMLIGFPVLVALGIPPFVANVTSNVINIPGQAAAVGTYRDYLKRIPWRYAWLLLPVAIGSAVGAIVLRHTSMSNFNVLVPWLILFGVVLFAFQPMVHIRLHNHLYYKHGGNWALFFIGLAILPISIYGGFFGAGYGFMMLAFLGLGKIHEIHMLAAMKCISAVLSSAVALVLLYSTGQIAWHVAIMMSIGATAGGYLGASSAKKVNSRWLRIIIIIIGLVAATHLALQNYSHIH